MSKSIIIAGLLGVVGVAIGAYAAHGLEKFLEQQQLAADQIANRIDQCEVAVRYHMLHTLAILAVSMRTSVYSRSLTSAVTFWILGIALFSGGLYSMVFLGKMGHWSIVPAGGFCFILGWASIVLLGISKSPQQLHGD